MALRSEQWLHPRPRAPFCVKSEVAFGVTGDYRAIWILWTAQSDEYLRYYDSVDAYGEYDWVELHKVEIALAGSNPVTRAAAMVVWGLDLSVAYAKGTKYWEHWLGVEAPHPRDFDEYEVSRAWHQQDLDAEELVRHDLNAP